MDDLGIYYYDCTKNATDVVFFTFHPSGVGI